jgi:hypothetical protein
VQASLGGIFHARVALDAVQQNGMVRPRSITAVVGCSPLATTCGRSRPNAPVLPSNDFNDAEAIAEAWTRPTARYVANGGRTAHGEGAFLGAKRVMKEPVSVSLDVSWVTDEPWRSSDREKETRFTTSGAVDLTRFVLRPILLACLPIRREFPTGTWFLRERK